MILDTRLIGRLMQMTISPGVAGLRHDMQACFVPAKLDRRTDGPL
ncbi:hypothetical protein [Blastopirellula retiformator]|nr:hypothetical protein [Blastopirellula retiformator]